MAKIRKFKCGHCKQRFDSEWTEEESIKEKEIHFGKMPLNKMVKVCDECFKKIMDFHNHAIGQRVPNSSNIPEQYFL